MIIPVAKRKVARLDAVERCKFNFSEKVMRWDSDFCCRDELGAGVCGLGPDFCGDGCISTCDYKSECDPGWVRTQILQFLFLWGFEDFSNSFTFTTTM